MKKTLVFLVTLVMLATMCSFGLAEADVVDEQGRIVRYGEPVHLTAYFCRSMPRFNEGDDINHNAWIQRYKDLYNIELEIVVLANGDDYKQKMTMAIASDKMPDLMYLDGNQYTQLAKAGKLADVTDLFDLYCGDILRSTLMGKDGKVFEQSYVNGRLYGFTKTKGMVYPSTMLYIRKDWLDKLNLEAPKTFDDLVKVAYAFANDDPDGNGQNDTYGLGLCNEMVKPSDYGSLQGVLAAYGGFSNTWVYDEESGTVSYGALNEGTKKGLEALAKMYADGVIDKEFGVKKAQQVGEDIAAGKTGMYFGTAGGVLYYLSDCMINNPEAEWISMNAMDLEGNDATVGSAYTLQDWFAVNAKCEHPEALFLLANAFQNVINNPKTTQEELNTYGIDPVTGVNKASYPYFACDPAESKDLTYTRTIRQVLKGEADESILAPEALKYYMGAKKYAEAGNKYDPNDITAWQYGVNYGLDGVHQHYLDIYESGKMLFSAWFGTETPTMVRKMSTLNDLQAETFTKIISGSASVDSFDDFVASWNRLGGEDITKEVNEWYAERYLNQ
ncbi:MAG: extracellular solute-binding protein [Clostridia bacterium]|nr:extracellular solute-binding protein [Clostridia bacterium]